MKEHQTPQKVFARSNENRNGRFKDFPPKKSNKITFTSVSEDSVDLSPISEISDANHNEDIMTLLEEPSSVTTLVPSDMTPKNITDTTGIGSTNCFSACELDSSKFASVEAEITVNFLRNVKHEVLNSINEAPRYRKLMDVIIEHVIHDFHSRTTLLEEKDHFARLLSMKNRMLFLCTSIWVIVVLVALFFTSDVRSPYIGPLPT